MSALWLMSCHDSAHRADPHSTKDGAASDSGASNGGETKDGGASDAGANDGGQMGASFCGKNADGGVGVLPRSPVDSAGEKCGNIPRALVEIPDCGPGEGHGAPLIAVNATHLYFIFQWTVADSVLEVWTGYLMRVPISGGKVETIASLPTGSVQMTQGLALTSNSAVFIQAPKKDGDNATIAAVPLAGGDVAVLAEAAGVANAVVVDDDSAYFTDTEGVKAVDLAGGATRTLASGFIPISLGLAGNTLYFTTSDNVYSVSPEGGRSVSVATGGGLSVTACGGGVCWLGGTGLRGTLMQLDPPGKPVELAKGFVSPHDLTFDGKFFFVAGGRGLISRVTEGGGAPVSVYAEAGITSVGFDGECLYWSSATSITSVSISAARTTVSN